MLLCQIAQRLPFLELNAEQVMLDPAKQICQAPGTIGSASIRGHR